MTRVRGDGGGCRLPMSDEIGDLLALPSTTLLIQNSAGKDSQAMAYLLHRQAVARSWRCRILHMHCDLGRMEWHETHGHCRQIVTELGSDLVTVSHARFDLLGGIEDRMARRADAPPFPSSAARYCTAGWKRDPASRWIRNHIGPGEACVVAMGLRAEESSARARKPVWQTRTGADAPTKNRRVIDWHPILHLTESNVWSTLGYSPDQLAAVRSRVRAWRAEGLAGAELMQRVQGMGFRAHPAYALGNSRLSCAMCVLACRQDLVNGMEFRPDTAAALMDIERRSGFSFKQGQSLTSIATGGNGA